MCSVRPAGFAFKYQHILRACMHICVFKLPTWLPSPATCQFRQVWGLVDEWFATDFITAQQYR